MPKHSITSSPLSTAVARSRSPSPEPVKKEEDLSTASASYVSQSSSQGTFAFRPGSGSTHRTLLDAEQYRGTGSKRMKLAHDLTAEKDAKLPNDAWGLVAGYLVGAG